MSRLQRALNVRGNIALGAAIALGLFLAAVVPASGWAPLHTWLAVALGVLAASALACYTLAGRVSVKGGSPRVTHHPSTSLDTPREVRK